MFISFEGQSYDAEDLVTYYYETRRSYGPPPSEQPSYTPERAIVVFLCGAPDP